MKNKVKFLLLISKKSVILIVIKKIQLEQTSDILNVFRTTFRRISPSNVSSTVSDIFTDFYTNVHRIKHTFLLINNY